MSYRPCHELGCILVAVLALALGASLGHTQGVSRPKGLPSGKPVQFADPNSRRPLDPTTQDEEQKQRDAIERETEKRSMAREVPSTSLSGVSTPGIRAVISGKKLKELKELMDRKKNWIFDTSDPLDPRGKNKGDKSLNLSLEDDDTLTSQGVRDPNQSKAQNALNDLQRVMNLSPVEEYYLFLDRQAQKTDKRKDSNELDSDSKDDDRSVADYTSPLDEPKRLRNSPESDSQLKGVFRPEPSKQLSSLAGMRPEEPDFFNLGTRMPTREEKLMHKANMDSLRQLNKLPIMPSSEIVMTPEKMAERLRGPVQQYTPPVPSVSPSSAFASSLGPQFGTIPAPVSLPDLAPKPVVPATFSEPAALKVDKAPVLNVMPPPPTFAAPRRAF